jgi:hypothetical protein
VILGIAGQCPRQNLRLRGVHSSKERGLPTVWKRTTKLNKTIQDSCFDGLVYIRFFPLNVSIDLLNPRHLRATCLGRIVTAGMFLAAMLGVILCPEIGLAPEYWFQRFKVKLIFDQSATADYDINIYQQ